MFSTQSENYFPIYDNIYDITSLFAAELEEPKIGIWSKGLKKGWKGIFPQLVNWLVGCLTSWMFGWQFGSRLFGRSVGWLVG